MAEFDFTPRTANGLRRVTGRELLARKAAQVEKERLAQLAKEKESDSTESAEPTPDAPTTRSREPRILNALFADGKINLPTKKDKASQTPPPSQLMDEALSQEAKPLIEKDVDLGVMPSLDDDGDMGLMPSLGEGGDVSFMPSLGEDDEEMGQWDTSPVVGVPPPGQTKTSGFQFSGVASEQELEQMGLVQAPVKTKSIPLPAAVSNETFFQDGPPDMGDIPFFDEQGEPILPQLGANRPQGMRMIAGIPATTFDGWDPDVPPGSHYGNWVWRAMDKPGHVTIELYVDARGLKELESNHLSVLERAYGPQTVVPRGRPQFDPARHVLISIPQPSGAPWGDATRVLLTPETIKPVTLQKNESKKIDFSSKSEEKTPPPSWESEPAGISGWLNEKPHHNVIFGRALLDAMSSSHGGHMYWMVLSKVDAERIHRRVYGDRADMNLDPEHRFGLEGVTHTRRYQDNQGQVHLRAVPPAKRYLGHWSGEEASRVMALARQGAGPQMPADWPKEDVDMVAGSHAGIAQRNKARQQAREHTLIAPRDRPTADLPPEKPKQKQPVNRMPMRTF